MKRLLNAGRILLAALREIFDEAPYARFLQRTGQAASVGAYAAFLRDREKTKEPKPRCC
jgi:hypothetical protein